MATKIAKKKPVRAALRTKPKAPSRPPPKHGPRPKARPAPSAPPQGTVEDYVAKVIPWQRAVIEKLRAVIRSGAPEARESLRWGQPVYEHGGPFAYVKAHTTHVNFGFWRGAELDDPKRLLQGEGERMRHVKLLEGQPLDELALGVLVKQAVKLNQKKGDPTKG